MTSPGLHSCPFAELLVAMRTPPPPAASSPPPPRPEPLKQHDGPVRLLWSIDEASARLSIGRSKMFGLLRDDLLPSIKLGGRRVIAEQDLVEFVDRLRGGWQPW